jgi:hypothetical protein
VNDDAGGIVTRGWSVLLWLPLLTLLALRAGLLASSVAGRPVLWNTGPVTLSEAAAYRDGGEVARQLAAGADPNAVYRVRRGAVRGRVEATPLEAAEGAGRADIVQLLRSAGATK